MTPERRRTRERAILHIIDTQEIRSQIELVAALAREGIPTTQTTLSRDFRRLGIVKRADAGGPRYHRPGRDTTPPDPQRMLAATLSELALDVGLGNALFAIRTLSGCANAVAISIDEAGLEGVLATVAGDDTILVLCRDAKTRSRLVDELKSLAKL